MKQYEKLHENYYHTEYRDWRWWRPENFDIKLGLTIDEYKEANKIVWKDLYTNFFLDLAKIVWLESLMTYRGKMGHGEASFMIGYFRNNKCGLFHARTVITQPAKRIVKWIINNHFPDFYEVNILENIDKYKWPYKYVSFEMVGAVYAIHYAKELLDYAEEQQMGYGTFIDYIINYVQCRNNDSEFEGEQEYVLLKSNVLGIYYGKHIDYEKRRKEKETEANRLRKRKSRAIQKRRLQTEATARRNENYARSKAAKRANRRANRSRSLHDAGQDGNEEGIPQSTGEPESNI